MKLIINLTDESFIKVSDRRDIDDFKDALRKAKEGNFTMVALRNTGIWVNLMNVTYIEYTES